MLADISALKVAVVGGSLSGLFNAIALRSLGCQVDVYEKSLGLMQDRGAGIVLQTEVTDFLTRYNVAALESIVVPVSSRRYLHADGSIADESAMPQAMTSWDALYRALRASFGDKHYHMGVRQVRLDANDDIVAARFDRGDEVKCNLLVGADGPGSTVRSQVLPEVQSKYAGYVAWRGVMLEQDAPDLAAELLGRFTFFQARHTHILCYIIPGPDGSLTPGKRRLNWVWYLNAAVGDELDRVLTDNNGRRREFSVPRGLVSSVMVDWLHDSARRILPPTFMEVVQRTKDPFVQTIHDLAVPKMVFGRVCLAGDAAFVPRPHTAAGSAKAAANALALADCLASAKGHVVEALRQWEPDQLIYGEQLKVYGQRLGNRSQFN